MSEDRLENQAGFDFQQRSEQLSWWTHAFGFLLSLLGGAILLPNIYTEQSASVFFACVLFVVGLLGVYLFSALSHRITDPVGRALFRRLDQAFIYILIVATFTPFTAAFLHHPWWYGVIGIMWFVAIAGFVSKIFFAHRVDRVAVWFYLLLGWTPVLGGMCTTPLLPSNVIWLIALGGFFYTFGTIFLFQDYRRWYWHGLWHLFVMAGSATHYLAILYFV